MLTFKMPDAGEGLVEAEVVSWRVKQGDQVKVHQVLVDIETAKSIVELPSPCAGTIYALLVAEGVTVEVGTPIALIDDGSGIDEAVAAAAGGGQAGAAQAPTASPTTASPTTASPTTASPTTASPTASAAPATSGPAQGADLRVDSRADADVVINGEASEAATPNLVGYGAKPGRATRRRRRGMPDNDPETSHAVNDVYAQSAPSRAADVVSPGHAVHAEPQGEPLPRPGQAPIALPVLANAQTGPELAKPPVRKLAKDLGVDLADVQPTGPGGTITRGDVEAAAAMAALAAQAQRRDVTGTIYSGQSGYSGYDDFDTPYAEPEDQRAAASEAPGSAQGGSGSPGGHGPKGTQRRVPIKGVRKATAEAMINSVSTHVHVTEWVTCDVTATMDLIEQLKARREFAGLRVSPLLLFARAACLAISRTPDINASWDEENQEIVFHGDVNLGVAAATPRGLMVPNIKGAQRMGLLELCRAINQLVQVSRDGRLQPADYSHGTFTITNVGVFGIDAGTPIINRDESAILCMGAIVRRPWVVGSGPDERVEPRWVTTVALSFDHRLIDGEQGSRFLHDVAEIVGNPTMGLLY